MVRPRAKIVPSLTPARQGASVPTIGVVTRGGGVGRCRGRGCGRRHNRGRGQTPSPTRDREVTPPTNLRGSERG